MELSVPIANQNSSINLLDQTSIHSFHTKMKNLSCGYHTLYIKRGDESLTDTLKNKVQIKISPLQLAFEIYHSDGANKPLEYVQNKKNDERYEHVCIKRVDDEPKKEVDIVVKNGSVATEQKVTKESETFKKLRELQKLIKKESSLKELCNYKNNIIVIISYSFKSERRHNFKNKRRM